MTPEQITALVTAIVALIGAVTALIIQVRHMINHDPSTEQQPSSKGQPPGGYPPAC